MRQMPFYGWIQDLSERDPTSLFNLFGLLPYDVPMFRGIVSVRNLNTRRTVTLRAKRAYIVRTR
jgi:hypothetical protein